MTHRIDLNADLGEHDGPPPSADLALLQVVTSANVACGGHAGDEASMRGTAVQAAARGVQVGAHPSYPDREGFGRRVVALSPAAVTDAVARQVHALRSAALVEGVAVRHVKPHGALYNVASRDRLVADAIAAAIVMVDAELALYAPYGSALAEAGRAAHLQVVPEGFLDRAYEDDGSLTPRSVPGAVLNDVASARDRAITWVRSGEVRARSGRMLSLPIETLCIHGDTQDAVALASSVRQGLESEGVRCLPSCCS